MFHAQQQAGKLDKYWKVDNYQDELKSLSEAMYIFE